MNKHFKLPLIIFDSECTMCTRFIQGLKVLDIKSHLNYVSLYDDDLYDSFPMISKDECKGVVHLIKEDKSVISGAEVVSYLTSLIPGATKLSWLLESDSANKAMSLFYNKLNRMRINQKRGCPTCK